MWNTREAKHPAERLRGSELKERHLPSNQSKASGKNTETVKRKEEGEEEKEKEE